MDKIHKNSFSSINHQNIFETLLWIQCINPEPKKTSIEEIRSVWSILYKFLFGILFIVYVIVLKYGGNN